MNLKQLMLVATVVVSIPAFASDAHEHTHNPQPAHGGVVVEAKDIDFELVAQPELIQLYLHNHGKPVDIAGGSAKVTLLSGAEKQEVELKPAGDHLEAKGSFKVGSGTKAVAVVNVAGNPSATARFTVK